RPPEHQGRLSDPLMPWFRLPSGVLWHGRSAPAGAQPAVAPTACVTGDEPVDVLIDHPNQVGEVGATVEGRVVASGDELVEVVPRVVAARGADDFNPTEGAIVDDLTDRTVSALRDYARHAGIDVPRRARKADLIALIHNRKA